MKLLGSTTSPFVRRLRLYLALLNVSDYEFINLDIFAEQDRKLLTENNPTKKVPALIDDEILGSNKCIYDSRVVFRYLTQKYQQAPLTWPQENLLTLIDAANDSLVSVLLCQRSGFDTQEDRLFFNLQRERVEEVMLVLNKAVAEGEFKQWQYPAICLFCLLDWAAFRSLFDFSKLPELVSFYQNLTSRTEVIETDPR